MLSKQQKRYQRHRRVRGKVFGTKERPRFCLFRSNQHIYAQIIDDTQARTLVSANDLMIKKKKRLTKLEIAKEVGLLTAKKALEKKINQIVFDRSGYKYHGRVKAMAEGARQGGLKF